MNLNRIIYKFSIIASFALLFTACGDSYLATPPQDSLTLEEFMGTPEKAQQLLNSSYHALRNGSFMGGQMQFMSELMADNINGALITNGDWLAHYTRTTDIFLGTTSGMMHNGGKAAARANQLIQNIDIVQGLSSDDRARMIAEGKFIRAIVHFETVRFFGQPYGYTANNTHPGISIRTTYGNDTFPRASVNEVYQQVIADFTDAVNDLPATNNGYATSWSAKAYLAKVYFQMNDFTNAYAMADDVIQNSNATFADTATRFLPGGSSENVFALLSTDFQNDHSGGYFSGTYRPDQSTGFPSAPASRDLWNTINLEPSDKRIAFFTMNNEGADNEFILVNKFPALEEFDVPLAHITELKLIRAESAAELNQNLAQAIQDLNDIRSRAGLTNVSASASANEIISKSRSERRIELFGEGNRLHELKRIAVNGQQDLKIRGADWDCAGMVCQLPSNELQGNPSLAPNPSGGCN